jgi:non-homologous end joining protein Ku
VRITRVRENSEGHDGTALAHRETKSEHFKPEEFEDRYEDALKELLKKKQSGEKMKRQDSANQAKVIMPCAEAWMRSAAGLLGQQNGRHVGSRRRNRMGIRPSTAPAFARSPPNVSIVAD